MPIKLSKTLRDKQDTTGIAPTIREYEDRFTKAKGGALENGRSDDEKLSDLYYDLATDFYEFGWGRSFHFAPRVPGESFKASLARHERYLAQVLGLKRDGRCRPRLRRWRAITGDCPFFRRENRGGGVNSNAYQLERARKLAKEADLAHLVEFLHCDFMNVDAPDNSFDAVYDIEATCHAPDKPSVYGEVFRLLKPGGCFGGYEYCLTDRFDPQDPIHLKIKADIERGGALFDIDDQQTVDNALRSVGFEVLETRDLSVQTGPSIPWYQPLVGSGLSFASFRSTRIGRWVTHNSLRALEALHIAPKGTVRVSETLNLCALAMAEAGRLGIFTPMYFIHARKPA